MLIVLQGAAISDELATVRDSATATPEFRAAVRRIGLHLAAECSKHLPVEEIFIQTPLEKTKGQKISGSIIIVPVLRAGLGLLDSFLDVLPNAVVGFEGLRRDESTLIPSEYYRNIPKSNNPASFIIIDPMIATGGSMSATLSQIKNLNPDKIIAASLIGAPEGLEKVSAEHPDVTFVVAAMDRELNEKGYILPGLGDAGDRLFGTT